MVFFMKRKFLHELFIGLGGLGQYRKNKIEGTPILKLAMIKRF